MYYVTDGSQKGNVVGAGVVFVNDDGKIMEFSFAKVLPKATSSMAEAFALECAIELFLGVSNATKKTVTFYVDHQELIHCAECINYCFHPKELYVYSVMKQLMILSKFRKVAVKQIDKERKDFATRAHKLSRTYLDDPLFSSLAKADISNFAAENYPTIRLL